MCVRPCIHLVLKSYLQQWLFPNNFSVKQRQTFVTNQIPHKVALKFWTLLFTSPLCFHQHPFSATRGHQISAFLWVFSRVILASWEISREQQILHRPSATFIDRVLSCWMQPWRCFVASLCLFWSFYFLYLSHLTCAEPKSNLLLCLWSSWAPWLSTTSLVRSPRGVVLFQSFQSAACLQPDALQLCVCPKLILRLRH